MSENLSFEKAEFDAGTRPSSIKCSACGQGIMGSYFELNQRTICESCRYQVEAHFDPDAPGDGRRLLQALLRGGGWALLGAIGYYLFVRLTHIEFALITIFIGALVGKAVFVASGGRGGWKYQLIAASLTYLSVASIYIPMLFEQVLDQNKPHPVQGKAVAAGAAAGDSEPDAEEDDAAPAGAEKSAPVAAEKPGAGSMVLALGMLVGLALISPFLGGINNILGILIIGFGVFRAFRVNQRVRPVFSGPFSVNAPAPEASVAPA